MHISDWSADVCSSDLMDLRKTENGSMLATARSLLAAANDDDFVRISTEAADQLADAQRTRTLPGGVLVVFDGEVDHPAKRIIGVIKAEPQNGFTRTRADGRMLLQYLEELLLTPQEIGRASCRERVCKYV